MPRTRLAVAELGDRVLPAGILFFGNSYTAGIPELVREVAAAAGQPPVVTGERVFGGMYLLTHAQSTTDPATVQGFMPAGQPADVVVLQGQSLEALGAGGPPDGIFRAGATGLAANVRAAFPAARFVLYETFARPTPNSFYPTTYADPAAMQADIRAGYDTAAADLRGLYGAAAAEVAPAGAAFAEMAHGGHLYADAGGHPTARGMLAAALTIYAAAFDDNVSDIPADRAATLLQARGLAASDWAWVTTAADRAVGLANLAQNERYVREAYRTLLGRAPDAGGLNFFLSGLTTGTLSRRQVAEGIASSGEAADRFVRTAYQQYLGRPADAGGLAFFTAQLRAGRGQDWVRTRLVDSGEYYQRAGGTPAGLIDRVYRDLLGREADPAAVGYWGGRLAGGLSRADFVDAVVRSREGRERQVRAMYQQYLGRPADSGGVLFFATSLERGMRAEAAAVGLLSSGELYSRLA